MILTFLWRFFSCIRNRTHLLSTYFSSYRYTQLVQKNSEHNTCRRNLHQILYSYVRNSEMVSEVLDLGVYFLTRPSLQSHVLVVGSQGRRRGDGTNLKVFSLGIKSQPGSNHSPWVPQPGVTQPGGLPQHGVPQTWGILTLIVGTTLVWWTAKARILCLGQA